MPWARFDDQFTIHRKVYGLTDAAFRLHVEAIFWCVRNLTDGFVAQNDLSALSRYRRPGGYVAELVDRGAWVEVDGGWQVNDFLKYQKSKATVLAERSRKADAGRKGGIRSGQSRRSKREANAKQRASPVVEHPSLLPSTKEETGRRQRSAPGAAPPVNGQRPAWCGTCGESNRMVELDNGTLTHCPRCHPKAVNHA